MKSKLIILTNFYNKYKSNIFAYNYAEESIYLYLLFLNYTK